MSSSEPTPSPAPELEELVLLQPLKPPISQHTGGQPDMDMNTGGFVDEKRKGTCDKCADCLACKKKKAGE